MIYDNVSEQALLASVLRRPNEFQILDAVVSPDDFHWSCYKWVWKAFRSLSERCLTIDVITLGDELKRANLLESFKLPDSQFMGRIAISKIKEIPTSETGMAYALSVQDYSAKRKIMQSLSEGAKWCQNGRSAVSIVSDLQNSLNGVVVSSGGEYVWETDRAAEAALKATEIAKLGGNEVTTGLIDLDAILAPQKTDLIVIGARPGQGKCLGKGTKILMFDGSMKNVEDVIINDLLMGPDSKPRWVKSTTSGIGQMYWVRQNRAMDYRVNENHILSLKRSKNEWSKKHGEIKNISVEDWINGEKSWGCRWKGYKVAVDFPEKETQIEPYFFGLWLGDGSSAKCDITNTDNEVISYLRDYAKRRGENLHEYKLSYSITNIHRSRPNTTSIKEHLRNLGVLNNKHIPRGYLINSRRVRMAVLAGIIDTDGYFDGGGIDLIQKNRRLIGDIKLLADSLGFRTSQIKEKVATCQNGYSGIVYRITIHGDFSECPVRIERKKQKEKHGVDWTMTGISIERDCVDEYFGFELDGDGLFLLEDMTVTHNSGLCGTIALANATHKKTLLFTIEMGAVQVTQRLIAQIGNLSAFQIMRGKLSDKQHIDYVEAANTYNEMKPYLLTIDKPAIRLSQIRLEARKFKPEVIVIDYIQLAEADKKNERRDLDIGEITRGLKALAKETNACVFAAAQLGRDAQDREPTLADLRESGSIENDADSVVFIYHYDKVKFSQTSMIIAKHRNGPVGKVTAYFDEEPVAFRNADKGHTYRERKDIDD